MQKTKLIDMGAWYWLMKDSAAHFFEVSTRISLCRRTKRIDGNHESARASDPELEKNLCKSCLRVLGSAVVPKQVTIDETGGQ